jgi:hypothetical protein
MFERKRGRGRGYVSVWVLVCWCGCFVSIKTREGLASTNLGNKPTITVMKTLKFVVGMSVLQRKKCSFVLFKNALDYLMCCNA